MSDSFLAAMDQLNQQYPPTQVREVTYSPIQPNVAASSSSSTSATPSSVAVTPSSPSPPQGQAITPGPHQQSPKYWSKLAAKHMEQVIRDWVPHPMSDTEIEAERQATARRLATIRHLAADQHRFLPGRIARIEHALFMARIDNKTRFFRIFRINDLPSEILGNIFHLVAWSAPDARNAIGERNKITSVCRHWRTVALDDVTLWNAVWFRDFSLYDQCFEWVRRAGNSALDVRINDTREQPLTLEMATRLITRLFANLSNIRFLIVVVQEWDPALFILHALRRVAEQGIPMILERFELHRAGSAYVQVGPGYEPSFYLQSMALFGGARIPSFRYLAVNGVHIDWEKSALVNLTALDIRRLPLERVPDLDQFRALLQKSPALSKLVLDGAGPQWPKSLEEIANVERVPLPNLKILVLGDFSVNYGAYVCSLITAQNVVDLTLMSLFGEDASLFFNQLTDITTSSVKSLTLHCTLDQPNIQAYPSIVKWLKSLPQLTFLRVMNVRKNFLDLFLYDSETLRPAVHPTQTLICPKIAYLEFHFHSTPMADWSAEHISTWVRTRTQLGFALRKVFVGGDTATSLTKEEIVHLNETMRELRVVGPQVLPIGQKPMEEAELIN